MAILDFQSFLLPVLKIMSNEKEYNISYLVEQISTYFNLTEDEKKELIPSGGETRVHNRTQFTLSYLKMPYLYVMKKGVFIKFLKEDLIS